MKLYHVAEKAGVPALIEMDGVEHRNDCVQLEDNPNFRKIIHFNQLSRYRIGATIEEALELYLNWRQAKCNTAEKAHTKAGNQLYIAKQFVEYISNE